MKKCKACGKFLWTKGKGVSVVTARPADDASSLMLLGEEEFAISTLNSLDRYVDAGDIKSGVLVCRYCWTDKLEPPQRAEIDKKVSAIESATDETPAVDIGPLGNLTAEYYVTRLADLLDETQDRNVRGWILFCAALRLQNYSKEIDQITSDILLPKVSTLTSDPDYDIARAAKLVLKAFDGQLGYDEWNRFTGKWTGFRKLP